jgi:hypothetical protein
LKTEPAAKDKPETYLYLGLPHNIFPGFDVFASAALDGELNPAFATGLGIDKGGKELRLEGFYTQKELAARKASSWFSSAPPLPERDFNIYALGAFFSSPQFSIATDWAYSETFAWGSGLYGNAAVRFGNRPWRFSLAGDGASARFADRSGSTTGSGLRLAAKAERFWPRSGLLRTQGTLRSPGLGVMFERANFSAYFRPSAPTAAERRRNPLALRFSRASINVSRDARKPEKTADALGAYAAYSLGPFGAVISVSLDSISVLDSESPGVFQFPAFESFESFKASGELSWRPPSFRFGALDLRARLGHTTRAEKKNLWDLSLNGSLRPGKYGRIGLKVASTDFPEKWNYTLSWRFEYGDKF